MEAVVPQRGSHFEPPCVWDHNNGSPNLKKFPWGKGMFCIKRKCPRSLAMALWEEQKRTIFLLFICKKYSIHIQVFFMSLKGNRFHSIISAQGLYFNVTTDGFAFTIKPVLLLTSSFSSKGLHWLGIIFSSKSGCCFSEGSGKVAWPEGASKVGRHHGVHFVWGCREGSMMAVHREAAGLLGFSLFTFPL